jgi:hypothetical protein
MRGWFLLALALLALLPATPAQAQGADPPRLQEASLALGPAGGEATLRYPFALAQDGEVYAKLLPTSWNPVLPQGQPNGSVASDRSAGLRGWWVRLDLEPAEGPAIPLGHFADSGASQAVQLPGGAQHVLVATIHAPRDAGALQQRFRVDLALVHRDAPATLDPAWSLAANLQVTSVPEPALGGGILWGLLAAAGAVAGGAALVAAKRGRGPREWL